MKYKKEFLMVIAILGSFFLGMQVMKFMSKNNEIVVAKNDERTGYNIDLLENNYDVSLTNDTEKIVFFYKPKAENVDAQKIIIPVPGATK